MDAAEIRLPSPKELRTESGLRQRRRLGQRFLTNHTTLDRIVGAARLEPTIPVIEIGAGPGYLTARIRRCADRVFAIELDDMETDKDIEGFVISVRNKVRDAKKQA